MTVKRVFIIEGSDNTGKTELSQNIQKVANGKCHIIHSNFNKNLPLQNHYRQHELIVKFIKKQFSKNYYTGNNIIICDRSYISDIVYGQLGYGSKGDLDFKLKKLEKIFKKLTSRKDIVVTLVYCRPDRNTYTDSTKEELVTSNENDKIMQIYDKTIEQISDICFKYGIKIKKFNYLKDPTYVQFNSSIFYSK